MDIIVSDHTPANLEKLYENHFLFKTTLYSVMCEATEIPWLQFIPNQPLEDPLYIGQLYAEIYQLAHHLKAQGLGPHFNVAKIGNKLPYYHIHLVFRTTKDCAWPEPIWCGMPLKPNLNAPQNLLKLLQDYPLFAEFSSNAILNT